MRRSRIKPISDKRKEQIILEKELAQRLYKKQKGLCARCDKPLGWRSAKHEQVFRSRGGSAIDEANCELLCGSCHSRFHGIIEPDPVTYCNNLTSTKIEFIVLNSQIKAKDY